MPTPPARRHLDFGQIQRPTVAMEANWPSGSSTGWHSHPRGQLLYAISGVMVIHSDAGTWVIPPSRALWLAADVHHDVHMSGDVQMRTAYIDASQVGRLPNESCAISVSPLLRELLVAAVRIPMDYPLGGREERLMALLVDEIRVSSTLALHLPLPHDGRVRRICDALLAQPADTATAADWAARVGVGAKTIHRLFVKETGMSFAQWREQARLLLALRRIAEGERIIDIAFDCGYASQSAFSAMFRRHFGAPPSAFYR